MTTLHVITPVQVKVPRFAPYAAHGFMVLLNWLKQQAEVRAARAQTAARAGEAAKVRVHAQQVARNDPRFAADLLAAADRHETRD